MASAIFCSVTKIGRDVHCLRRILYISTRSINVTTAIRKEASTSETLQQTPGLAGESSGYGVEIAQSASESLRCVDMASYGIGGWLPSDWTPYLFEVVYNSTQLPWWGCIVSITILTRLAQLPSWIKCRNKVKYRREVYYSLQKQLKEIKVTDNIEIVKKVSLQFFEKIMPYYIPFLLNGAVYMSLLLGLNKMIVASVGGLGTGGTLWFPDLLAPDPFGILPLLCSVTFFTNRWIIKHAKRPEKRKRSIFFHFVGSLLGGKVLVLFPSGLMLYVFSSLTFTLIRTLAIDSPHLLKSFSKGKKRKF